MQLPTREEAEAWTGYRLDEFGGAGVGRIHGIFVDAHTGETVWTIARLGRFGKLIAIPFRDCAAGAGHVWAAHDRGRLRGAPAIDGDKPLTREQELAICEHYGLHEEVGRARQVAGREPGAVTSHQAPASG
jgi:hypothetical protein